MRLRSQGVSTAVAAAVVVVLLAVAGGAYLLFRPSPQPPSQTSSSTSAATTESTSTLSSTLSTSSQTSTGSSTTGACSGNGTLIIALTDQATPVAGADVVANYSVRLTALGSVPGTLAVSAEGPPGFRLSVTPSTVETASAATVQLSVGVQGRTAPGQYPLTFKAVGQGQCYSSPIAVSVVPYLVVTVGKLYQPASITVPAGATVTWVRLNGALDQYDSGAHNVKFDNGMATSPTLLQYGTWSYTFTSEGTFSYYCTFHPTMTGQVTVTM